MLIQTIVIKKVVDANLGKGWRSCQFSSVDSDLERARNKVFNYAIEDLDGKILDEKLD